MKNITNFIIMGGGMREGVLEAGIKGFINI
jgi:hypothetical protein